MYVWCVPCVRIQRPEDTRCPEIKLWEGSSLNLELACFGLDSFGSYGDPPVTTETLESQVCIAMLGFNHDAGIPSSGPRARETRDLTH